VALCNNHQKIRNDTDYKEGLSQKLTLFATKTSVLGDKKIDVNNFINYEIELCYKSVEFQLKRKVEYVQIMEDKVERIKLQQLKENPAGNRLILEEKKNKLC
jgi:hypothetical protein